MKVAVFPVGTSGESYYFVLNQEGVLTCNLGIRKDNNINQDSFLEVVTASSEIQLSKSNVQLLVDMANKLEEKGCAEKHSALDSWEVALLYNGKVYEMDYWGNEDSEEYMNLVNKIIELSPMPVDLHGWA